MASPTAFKKRRGYLELFMQHLPDRSRSARNRGHAFVKRRSRFGEITGHDGAKYAACIFYTRLGHAEYGKSGQYLIEAVAKCILDYNRMDLFKKIPGHERYHTPISEYLHKSLQPKLDDLLFVGRGYETAFDEFEVLFALAVADLHRLSDRHVWGPVGRFGWKGDRGYENPLGRVIEEARSLGANWEPLRAGLFGGSLERFEAVATEFQQQVSRLNWW